MIEIVQGKTGSGKSTYLAYRASKALKKGIDVYSNVYIKDTFRLNISDLGKYEISNALIIIDEAGFEFNSRQHKQFTNTLYRFFTMHRHYNLDIILAVQFWDRLDLVIRELVHTIKVCTKLGPFTVTRDVKVSIKIPKQTHELTEVHEWQLFSRRFILRRKYYYMFDSYYKDNLPEKQFERYVSR